MTLYQYTALHNPMDSARLISSYGIRPQMHPKVLALQLAEIVKKDGQPALEKVADIHPDMQLFQKKFDDMKLKAKEETHSNACGCESHSNATGQNIKSDVEDIKSKESNTKTEMLIIGGIVLGALALILKK